MLNSAIEKTGCFQIFSGYPLVAAFSNRSMDLGFSCSAYAQNRRAFLESLSIDCDNLACSRQAHSTNVAVVGVKDRGRIIGDTDGFITNSKDMAIAVFTADCLPVFIYDRKNHAIGLAHAGWRGSKGEIVKKTAIRMRQEFGSEVGDLLCAFGPAIGQCCYEVGEDIADYFLKNTVTKRDGKLYLDLAAVNKKQLLELGITAGQIEESNLCSTCLKDRFFSFRREKEASGRTMSVMTLK